MAISPCHSALWCFQDHQGQTWHRRYKALFSTSFLLQNERNLSKGVLRRQLVPASHHLYLLPFLRCSIRHSLLRPLYRQLAICSANGDWWLGNHSLPKKIGRASCRERV